MTRLVLETRVFEVFRVTEAIKVLKDSEEYRVKKDPKVIVEHRVFKDTQALKAHRALEVFRDHLGTRDSEAIRVSKGFKKRVQRNGIPVEGSRPVARWRRGAARARRVEGVPHRCCYLAGTCRWFKASGPLGSCWLWPRKLCSSGLSPTWGASA